MTVSSVSGTTAPQATASTSTNVMDEFFDKFYAKADSLDSTIRSMAENMNGDKAKIDALQKALTDLRNARPTSSTGTASIPQSVIDLKTILGTTDSHGRPKEFDLSTLGISKDATTSTKLSQSQFDTAITDVKGQLDQSNSLSQEAVIQLQQSTNQLTQIYELMSNFLSKFGTALQGMVSNIR